MIVTSKTDTREVPLAKVPGRDYWQASESFEDGSYTAACALTFGPEGHEVTEQFAEAAFAVDTTAPTVAIETPPAGWYAKTDTISLTATVVEKQKLESVKMRVEENEWIAGASLDGGQWAFDVAVASLASEDIEKEFDFVIEARDAAGNVGKAEGVLKVDMLAPRVVLDDEAGWFAFGRTATVVATVTDGGEVVASVLEVNGRKFDGVGENDKWTFSVPADEVVDAGHQGALSFTVTATDAAGNEGRASSRLNIDTVAPTVTVVSPPRWFARDETAVFTVDISDAGALNPATIRTVIGSKSFPGTFVAGAQWRFSVPLNEVTAADFEGQVPFEIHAADMAGNPAVESGALKVDAVAPRLELTGVPGGWLARSSTATITATLADGGELDSSAVKIVFGARSFPGVHATGDQWRFDVPLADATEAQVEGTVAFEVQAADMAGNKSVETGSLKVDGVEPQLDVTAPTGWLGRSSTATITARISEAGALDLSSVKVVVGTKSFVGVHISGVEWKFDVPISQVSAAGFEGAVAFEVQAADMAGNKAVKAGSLKVDDAPPQVSVTGSPDSTWRRIDPFDFTATVSASGAPVKSATLSGPNGTPMLANSGTASKPKFVVKPADWQADGKEGTVAWTLNVEDEAGNVSRSTGALKIDRKAPLIDVNAPTQWFSTPTVNVSPMVTDAGSGPSTTYMTWEANGQTGNCSYAATKWTCVVSTALGDGLSTANFPFKIRTRDAVGNAAEKDGFLKIDKKGPVVTLVPDGKWYGRDEIITVRATITDDGVGFPSDENAPPLPELEVISPKASTHTGIRVGNQAVFSIPASSIVNAGSVAEKTSIVVKVWDLLNNKGQASSTSQFRIDGSSPTVKSVQVQYPSSKGSSVAIRDPFNRGRDTAIVRATIMDQGSGLVSSNLKLIARNVEHSYSAKNGDVYSFHVDASRLALTGASGSFPFSIIAKDEVGLEGSSSGNIAYDRILWERTVHAGAPPVGGLALAHNTVYATLNRRDGPGENDYNIIALDNETGKTTWAGNASGWPTTPVTVANNTVIFGSSIGELNFFSTDSTGTRITPDRVHSGLGVAKGVLAFTGIQWGNDIFSPVASDRNAIFYAGNDSKLRVFSHSLLLGWRQKYEFDIPGSSGPVWSGSDLYVGSTSGRVARIKSVITSSGPPFFNWTRTMEYEGISPVISGNNSVDFLGLTSNGHIMFTASSTARFLTSALSTSYTTTMGSNIITSPNMNVSGQWLVGDTQKNYRWLKNGSATSNSQTGSVFATSPVHALGRAGDDQTYAAFADKSFRLFAGSTTWSVPLASTPSGEFVLDCHGIAYVGTANGTFYAIVTDSVGLAKSAWPRFQHDNRNTGDVTYKIWDGDTCID